MTAIIASSTAVLGFGTGVIYAIRRIPKWLADMTAEQVDTLITKAEKIKASR